MRLRSVLNRLLYAIAPGLGQVIDGRWLMGSLFAISALGTLTGAEVADSRYRQLAGEYRKLNLPAPLHAELRSDRQRGLLVLAALYIALGVLSAALYSNDGADGEPPPSEEV